MVLILKIDDPRWPEFVEASRDASPFHHPMWAALLAECYGYRPFALCLADPNGQVATGLPAVDVHRPLGGRRWVALPFTDYCPILSRGDPTDGVDALGADLADAARALSLAALEVHAELPPGRDIYPIARGVRHTLLLSDPDEVFRGFGSMHKRNIRRSTQRGLNIHFGCTPSDMDVFYRLHTLTRRRLGVPVQPRRFFRLLARRLAEYDLGFVLSVRVDETPVAAAVFLNWNRKLVYKYGASDSRFWSLRPNNHLFWAAIRWACEHGYRTLDLGRSDVEDRGLRAFKSGWGATEHLLTYSVIGPKSPRPSSKHSPQALAAVIRRSPPWVCQLVGELLYRYTA